MDSNTLRVGDEVSESPRGAGTITDFTERGYPQVNHVAVAWLKRSDGAVFDPHGHVGGNRGADPLVCRDKDCGRTSPAECGRRRCEFPGAGE